MQVNTPNIPATSVYVPWVSHSCPLPPQETLQDQQVGLAQASMTLLLLPLVLVQHEILCAPCKSRVSISPNPV